NLLYQGLRQHDIPPARVCAAYPLGGAEQPARPAIAVLATREDRPHTAELKLLHEFERIQVPTLICLRGDVTTPPPVRHQWLPASVIVLDAGIPGSPIDDTEATRQLVNGIRSLKAVDELSLARHL